MRRKISRHLTNPIMSIEGHQRKLGKHLERRLSKEVDVVPCPDCGWLQRNMRISIKLEYIAYLVLIAVGITFATVATILVIASLEIKLQKHIHLLYIPGSLFVLLGLLGAWLTSRDLNTENLCQKRLAKEKIRAIRRRDFAELLPEELFAPAK